MKGGGLAYVREASHAGSWYSKDRTTLGGQLEGWLEAARADQPAAAEAAAGGNGGGPAPVRAIIAPHAGYSYSGPTAAFAYMHLDAARVKRIFVVGPSHHVYLKSCAVSGASMCATPVGDLQVDEAVRAELLRSPLFQRMGQSVDEDEHSIEMHLPYVAQVVKGREGIMVVPIMVGAIDAEQEAEYGRFLAPYLEDPTNFFIISSDFCHWGSRFRYQPYDAARGATIGDYIEWLDRQGMALIEAGDPAAFHAYLKEHHNTICGRHPIAVFMHAAVAHKARTGRALVVRFVRYAQSSRCRSKQDSSVSYASAVAREEEGGHNGGKNGGGKKAATA